MNRPILNQTRDAGVLGAAEPASSQSEGPVATSLPVWDLVPPHTFVPRRPVKVTYVAPVPDVPAHASPSRPVAPQEPVAASAALDDAASSTAVCRQCHEPVEDGAGFCSECGTPQP